MGWPLKKKQKPSYQHTPLAPGESLLGVMVTTRGPILKVCISEEKGER